MKILWIQLFYREDFIVISRSKGFTLIEVIMGTALAGLVMLGLAVVYLLGVDAWGRTSTRIELQRTATSAIYEITRDIQRADSLEILEGGNALFCRVMPFENDSNPPLFIIYNIEDLCLLKKYSEVNKKIIPSEDHDSLSIELLEGLPLFKYSTIVPTAPYEKIVDINFRIVHKKDNVKELMPFTTTVGARNL